MAKKTKKKLAHKKTQTSETDSSYVLKLILYLMIGSQWLLITHGEHWQIPVPYGAVIALLFARHDHFKIDRKVEYAVILVAMFVGFWTLSGINLLV